VQLINKLGTTVFKPNIDAVLWAEKERSKFPVVFSRCRNDLLFMIWQIQIIYIESGAARERAV
jgi:hypothetical protein